MAPDARAFWVREPGVGEIRPVSAARPGSGRGPGAHAATPGSAAAPRRWCSAAGSRRASTRAMRAPFQDGDFPGPVKYGYLNVGVVEHGPPELRGRTVFCLYPHQSAYVVPAAAVVPVPDDVPPARAVLAGTVETAVNALWDAAPLIGDRVTVVGAGMVGCCVARLLARLPGSQVTLVDVDAGRAEVADRLGVDFARPGAAPGERTSSSTPAPRPPGCSSASTCSRTEGTVDRAELVRRHRGHAVARRGVPLAAARHPGQPGRPVAPARRATRTAARPARARARAAARPRLRRAAQRRVRRSTICPTVMPRLASGQLPALCHTITYDEG